MNRLEEALAALATALERQNSLAGTIFELEIGLGRAFGAAVSIRLGDQRQDEPATALPLVLDGERFGTISIECEAGRDVLDPAALAGMRLLSAPVAAAIVCRLRREERVELGRFARVDALCKIPNRLAFEERLRVAWARCRDRKTSLTLALVDVDFFKSFNDRYGHVAGDRCLRRVASLFADEPTEGSGMFAARYGGEEFVILFEGIDAAGGFIAAQDWLERLTALGIEHGGTTLGYVSASVGVAAIVPSDNRAPVELVEEADRALYRAKSLGRNRICAGDLASQGQIVTRRVASARQKSKDESSTFGRDADLARILAALRHARVLTLVGPSGIGKSRLLELVAHSAKRQFERVVHVEPEWLRGGADPAAAIAAVLDLAIGNAGLLAGVTDALSEHETLILLDGVEDPETNVRAFCEHLTRYTADVSVIAAAQAPLGIAGERAIVVPPLDDEAALALLNRNGGDGTELMRRVVRYLRGNPAAIADTGGRVARFGADATLAWLEATTGAGALG